MTGFLAKINKRVLLGSLFCILLQSSYAKDEIQSKKSAYIQCVSSLKIDFKKQFTFDELCDESCQAKLFEASKSLGIEFAPALNELRSAPSFSLETRSVDYYARPRSKAHFDHRNESNKKNSLSKNALIAQLKFIQEHRKALERIDQEYGVPFEILVAIFYMETRLQKFKLPHRAYEVFLSQLHLMDKYFTCSPPQERRLKRLLRMSRVNLLNLVDFTMKEKIPLESIRSSWAGACGPMQFMPMNFVYLIDGNQDSRVELAQPLDAIASAAVFLVHHNFPVTKGENWDREKMIHSLRRYNANDYYSTGVYEIALELKNKLYPSQTEFLKE